MVQSKTEMRLDSQIDRDDKLGKNNKYTNPIDKRKKTKLVIESNNS